MTWAFAKAILLGEHAVVYGHPALAGAIDCPVRCRIRPGPPEGDAGGDTRQQSFATGSAANSAIHLRAPDWNLAVQVTARDSNTHSPAHNTKRDTNLESPPDTTIDRLDAPARALRALIEHLASQLRLDIHDVYGELAPATIEIETSLPPGAGLGSSAALSVAVVRALADALGYPLANADVAAVANSAERCFHTNPSGVDVALAASGGMGIFRRDTGLRRIDALPVPLAVGLAPGTRKTGELVARVAAARDRDRTRVDAVLAKMGQSAQIGAATLEADKNGVHDADDVDDVLGALMTDAHRLLAELGVSSPMLNRLVEIALAAGASGAKLTGAGGAGAVLALARGREEAVLRAWKRAGFTGFVCRVGVRP